MAVKLDYNQTLNQAKLLDELAADMQGKCVRQMGEVYDNVHAAWSGEAAGMYLKYIRGVSDDVSNKAKYLKEIASFLRDAVKKMQAADAAAAQSAQKI